jgi:hypothetical protein
MILGISGLSRLTTIVRLLASILLGVFYADKLGIVDVTGRLRDRMSGQATPGGGGA